MRDFMQKYFDVGIVHFMAYPETIKGDGPVDETITKILYDDYFNAIEVTMINDSETRKIVKEKIKTSHIKAVFGGQPILLTKGLNVNNLDEAKRVEAVNALKEGIDQTEELDLKAFAFLSGNYEEETKEESYRQLVKSTSELCKYAKDKDIRIVLEIFDYDIDKKSLIGPTSLAKRFADEITKSHTNFGLMVDLSHIPMYYEKIEDAILPIKNYIVHAHIGNTVIKDPSFEAYGDAHPPFGFENGENDVEEVKEFLKVLFNVGYFDRVSKPIVSFEVKPYKDQDVNIVIANAKRVLNQAWAELEL